MSTNKFAVAIHYGDDMRGKIIYDEVAKDVQVILPEAEWVKKVEDYLHGTYIIEDAVGLSAYESKEINPLDSVDNLKLALTRLWEQTDVQVDWSWPVDID